MFDRALRTNKRNYESCFYECGRGLRHNRSNCTNRCYGSFFPKDIRAYYECPHWRICHLINFAATQVAMENTYHSSTYMRRFIFYNYTNPVQAIRFLEWVENT